MNYQLILWGEIGVVVLLLVNILKRYKTPTIQRPDKKAFYLEHFIYAIVCAVVIYFLNSSTSSEALKSILGLKPGNLTEVYCFFSVGLSISSINKQLFQAALS